MTEAPRNPSYVLAAGGLLEKPAPEGIVLAIVHRKRHRARDGSTGDWVLPKGKHEPNERLRETAVREVREETGCGAEITGPCFPVEYLANEVPKLVLFFRMRCVQEGGFSDSTEIQEVVWLTPAQAVGRLTYETEREIVRQAYPDAFPG